MRSAAAVACFVEFCARHDISQPPDKIVKNLCTFLCQDAEQTPTFAFTRQTTDGILSFQRSQTSTTPSNGKESAKGKDPAENGKTDEAYKAQLSRRGARLAFDQLSAKFGPRLLRTIPNMWQSMAGGLLSTFQSSRIFWIQLIFQADC
jgi:TATA-binding protein-associated factor